MMSDRDDTGDHSPAAGWVWEAEPLPVDARHIKAKVCLVGDPAVGKTSLIRRFVLDTYDDKYLTTIGTKIYKKEVGLTFAGFGPSIVDLMVWDIMGQPAFRELLREAYFQGVDGILAVADVTRRDTLESLPTWIGAVVRTRGPVPIVVAANKADRSAEAAFGETDASRTTQAPEADIFLTSARTGANVEEAFRRLATRVVDRLVPLIGGQGPESE
jgi:small GTP-binding protein